MNPAHNAATQWCMVPVEPTPAQLNAGYARLTSRLCEFGDKAEMIELYAAMLRASPPYPAATSSDAGREGDLSIAREIAALFWDRFDSPSHRDYSHAIRRERKDDCEAVQVALLALARAGGDGWRTEITWEVWEDDLMVASADSEKEARHYFAVYSQDGPVRLVKAETRRLDITPAAPDAEVL